MQNVFEQKTTDLLHAIYDIILFTGQIRYDQSVRLVDLGKFLESWVVLSRLFSTYYLSSLLLCIYLSVLSLFCQTKSEHRHYYLSPTLFGFSDLSDLQKDKKMFFFTLVRTFPVYFHQNLTTVSGNDNSAWEHHTEEFILSIKSS